MGRRDGGGPGLLLAVVAALAALGCRSTRTPRPPEGRHVTVMTYNINCRPDAPGSALEAILGQDADLVCLQETTPAWEPRIRKGLASRYPHMAFRHAQGPGGLAILSKHPFTEKALMPPVGDGWFPAWIVLAETPVGPIQILNLHLRPPLPVSDYISTRSIRENEIRIFCRSLQAGLPALVCGDLNEESGKAVSWLQEQDLTDALPEFDARTPTWRGRLYGMNLQARLDHVFYSNALLCVEARVVQEGSSDHAPVIATFEPAPRTD